MSASSAFRSSARMSARITSSGPSSATFTSCTRLSGACGSHGRNAIRYLREAARLGESPYLEDAHFFLAKALIRDGDVEAARGELRTVLALEGDRRDEASRLLAELP